MSALDFASKIYFEKASPISGPFDLPRYPMLGDPLLTLDNIYVKQCVVYKASSSLGTIFLQIATAYRIAKKMGDMMNVTQTDDDAKKWSKTRGKPFFLRIPEVKNLIGSDKNAITNELWQFIHKFLIITGPGENSQNSDQVRFLQTDEGHLQSAYPPGTFAALEKRMGGRWDRAALHVSTAADEGAEIDLMYHEGSQKEWHHRCPKCHVPIWMLWEQDAKDFYGQRIFHWKDKQSKQATLDSIQAECPHCGKFFKDESQVRFALTTDGVYVPMNPDAAVAKESFRWSVFAAHWISWATILDEWLSALKAARIGDLKKHEDFRKKRETKSYKKEIPDLGDVIPGQDYYIPDEKNGIKGDVWVIEEERKRFASFDVQDAPLHFWAQCDEFALSGASRRVAYARLDTFQQLREFQEYYSVDSGCVGMDMMHRQKEVFKACAAWKWLAMGADDKEDFTTMLTVFKNKPKVPVPRPFTQPDLQDAWIGRKRQKIEGVVNGVPPGWCLSRLWSKPTISSILYHLKSGQSERYYGIAKNIGPDYVNQIHSYVPVSEAIKKGSLVTKVVFKQIKTEDHSFATSSQILILAMIAGFFPMDFSVITQTELDAREAAQDLLSDLQKQSDLEKPLDLEAA